MKTIIKKAFETIHHKAIPLETKLLYSLGYNNAAGIKKNAVYGFYHWICRYNFRRLNGASPRGGAAAIEAAKAFRQNAVVVIPPDEEVLKRLDTLPTSFFDTLGDSSSCDPKMPFLSRYFFSAEEFHKHVVPLITPTIDAALKQIFQSNYLASNAYMYRTTPSNEPPRSSFLWHFDDHPECHLKLFFYLTDTYRSNGAIQIHTWKSARQLKKKGFLDRRKLTPALEKELNDERRISIVEGKRGTSFIFCENTVHRAVIPQEKHRDVLTIELLPSPHPTVQFMGRGKIGYWQNPMDILFPSPGKSPHGIEYSN